MARSLEARDGTISLIPGQRYRRTLLHEHFGGQQQGGVSTPPGASLIMLFTGASGTQHGYEDGWSDGAFCYFGEGQIGDMPWVRGNRAIRDHVRDGKDLLLFKILREPRSYVEFMGRFVAESWDYRQAPDRQGDIRRAIVFHLVPQGTELPEPPAAQGGSVNLAVLRAAAEQAGTDAPERQIGGAVPSYIQRASAVRDYALVRAAGVCELCDQPARFHRPNGEPYLEVHHIHRLTDGGPDRIAAVAALHGDCHSEAHHGARAHGIREKLAAKIRDLERRMAVEMELQQA